MRLPVPRCRSRRHLGPWILALAAMASVGAGCGASSPSSATPSAEDWAAVVVEVFRLPASTRSCVTEQFSGSSAARSALATVKEPSLAAQEALGAVVGSCVSVDELAASVAGSISAALPAQDPSQTEAQTACLTDAIVGLDDGRRRLLTVGLLTLGGPLDSDLALARNELVNGLYAGCGVSVGP